MKKVWKRLVAAVLLLAICAAPIGVAPNLPGKAKADTADKFISFGADLRPSEKAKVMQLLGVSQADLSSYKIITVTNKDEHNYLDKYVSSSKIGTRALSSVTVVKGKDGSGLGIETKNISYCSNGMYCNALITAGVKDADVVVAGPFNISGTAALVGAMKAYAEMNGKEVDQVSADAATNELVVTGKLAESVGPEKATQFVALAKQKVIEGKLSSDEDINKAIEESAKSVGISLTEAQKKELLSLFKKIKGLNIDVDSLKTQAKAIYDKIKDYGFDLDQAKGFFAKIGDWFSGAGDWLSGAGEKVGDFFSGIADKIGSWFD